MDPSHDISNQASCTTCTFSEDFYNYCTAVLYFRARDGTYKRVPQLANQNLAGADGGMTVYYISPDNKTTNITAFKPVSPPILTPFPLSPSTRTSRDVNVSPGFPYVCRHSRAAHQYFRLVCKLIPLL
jgi:multidrug efflux pump subunit AcrA (membrane-fusion protein)